uniref:Uncharacterized protein n=1 Tax=Picea glauca TaxID=3330 RepID=A0A117NHE4_PICGL|nr:hypothetical protein ABT39_MTgene5214 [Picea glauca]QHR91188.1 hypothetical protein Q903MT_gene5220 [Picea sitchensis]
MASHVIQSCWGARISWSVMAMPKLASKWTNFSKLIFSMEKERERQKRLEGSREKMMASEGRVEGPTTQKGKCQQ